MESIINDYYALTDKAYRAFTVLGLVLLIIHSTIASITRHRLRLILYFLLRPTVPTVLSWSCPSKVFTNCLVLAGARFPSKKLFYREASSRIGVSTTRRVIMAGSSNRSNGDDQGNGSRAKLAIHWFRNGLRLHDNPCLLRACLKSEQLLPFYVINSETPMAQTTGRKVGCIRVNFVLESLLDLHTNLQKLNKDQKLIIILGDPKQIVPNVAECLKAEALYYERESAEPILTMDQEIETKISQLSLEEECAIQAFETHNLHTLDDYLKHCKDDRAPSSYGAFTKVFNKMTVRNEVETVSSIPTLPDLSALKEKYRDSMIVLRKGDGDHGNNSDNTMTIAALLQRLGYENHEEALANRAKGGIDFKGGETAGSALLEHMMKRTQWVSTFEKPKTSPNALSVDTTGLSPYVKHGCVSAVKFYHELSKTYRQFGNTTKLSQPPVSLHGQLIWREYNYLMGYTIPNFDKMEDNPVARQIPWDHDPELLRRWKESETGFPFIDAIMTQLRETGWIHHLARHAVACFLTRGDLWQSWEQGAAVFEELLIDADWSINNFNWQWLSCTAHFYQYFRCYSPESFGKKTDPSGNYIRKWLPKFRGFPDKYIYEPWNAPVDVQKKHGLVIGKDYPEPIVDHKVVSKDNMQRMKQAYDAHKAAQARAAAQNDSRNGSSSNNNNAGSRKRHKTS